MPTGGSGGRFFAKKTRARRIEWMRVACSEGMERGMR